MSTTQTAVSWLSIGSGSALVAQATLPDMSSVVEKLGFLGALLLLAGFFGWLLSGHLTAQNAGMQKLADVVTASNDRASENHAKSIEVLAGLLHASQELATRVASLEQGHTAIKDAISEIRSIQLGGRK